MPKIRGFKADLWTDEDFVELSPYARLLWMGMWNYACDNGHLADKSKQIKMRVLPTDDINCAELLRELEANGNIVRKDGVITIPNFARHQKPDKRYFLVCDLTPCLKPGADSQPETRGGNAWPPASPEGPHDEVNRSEVNRSEVMVKDAPVSKGKKNGSQLPASWRPTVEHETRALAAGLILGREADKFRAHAEEKRRLAVNWNAAFTRWLINAEDYATQSRPAQRPSSSLPLARQIEEPPAGLDAQQYDAWFREQAAKHRANQ